MGCLPYDLVSERFLLMLLLVAFRRISPRTWYGPERFEGVFITVCFEQYETMVVARPFIYEPTSGYYYMSQLQTLVVRMQDGLSGIVVCYNI